MEHAANEGFVKTALTGNILTISFYHPKSNSLPSKILAQLAQAIKEAGENSNINAIILASEGDRVFCAGASFIELSKIKTFEEAAAFFRGFANVLLAMRNCPKFIVGRVQGKSVGGGVGLVAACDYCLATKHSYVKLSELSLGIGPFVIGPALMRKIGVGAFSHLTIDSKVWFAAEWAQQHGLFTQVNETISDMDEAMDRFKGVLTDYNPKAMAYIKKMTWSDTENWDTILMENAEKSARLLLEDATQLIIQNIAHY